MILFALIEAKLQVSPVPQQYKIVNESFTMVGQLKWQCKSNDKDCTSLLKRQQEFYTPLFFPNGVPTPNDSSAITDLVITLVTTELPKSPMKSNETYKLVVTGKQIVIEAFDTFACSRALATLSQLIQEIPDRKYEKGIYGLQQYEILDFPVYKFRQLMIDPSRHFLASQTIKRQIDALAVTKMNVLHIHVIDTQSSAFQPSTEPAVDFGKGAFYTGGAYKHYIETYNQIAKYALDLGVFIMPEFDMPGHATVWRLANDAIVAHCNQENPNFGTTVNPIPDLTYVYIEAYMKDLIDGFFTPFGMDPLMHMGGDEVQHSCWQQDPEIAAYMKEKGINTRQLWQQFHKRVGDIFQKLTNNTGTRFYWQEAFNNANDFTTSVVNAYSDRSFLKRATDNNTLVIRSDGWYLDLQFPGGAKYAFQNTWENFYQVRADENVANDKKHLVLGGGACMWGEKVADGNIDEQIWPRTIAVAEALWTSAADRSVNDETRNRLQAAACKLLQAGVRTGAIAPSAPCIGFGEPRE